MPQPLVIHLFHDDAASTKTGSHVAQRIQALGADSGITLEVFVFGPAEKALADPANAPYRETLAELATAGTPVHLCRNDAEALGKADEFTRLGFTLEYARDAFVRYARGGATVITF